MKTSIKNIVKHADVSEKSIERYLVDCVKNLGGICLKYSNSNMVGYPDRVALLPNGKTAWIELKSTGRKPSKIQVLRFTQMASIGHPVFVLDSKTEVNNLFRSFGDEI